MTTTSDWKAPFHGNLIENLICPACEDETVIVREDSSADPRPAYCVSCHALLTVQVYETFGEPAIVRRALEATEEKTP